ncbi:TPA: YopX family protein [Streptococcus suis]
MIPKFRVAYKNKILGEIGAIDFIDETVTIPVYDSETGEYLAYYELGLNQVTLMQSTGLFDKQGYGIWEGDVVEFEDADDIENVYINRGVIEWCQGGFTVSNRTNVTLDDLIDGDKLEVTIIGNVWENPELMEG